MTSLIPDVSGNLRINTVGAMGDYQNAMKNIRDAVASPGDLINRLIESNERDKRAAEEQKRYETELGFKQRQEGRVVDELNRAQATREAVQAQLNPGMYRNSKLTEVDNAIQQSLANLSPKDRAIAEQEVARNYNRNASGNYVLDSARANVLADPTAVLSAQANQLNLRLKDPNSAEFKAAQQAEWDAAKRKMDYSHGLDMARIGAEEKKEYDKGKQLADLLNVKTFKTIESGDNQRIIDDYNRSNNTRAYMQEKYSQAISDLSTDEKTKQKPGESDDAFFSRIDAIAKERAGVAPRNPITAYGQVDVPEYEKYRKTIQLTPREHADELMGRLEGKPLTPTMIREVQNQIKTYADTYANQSKADREIAINAATLNDLKEIISRNGMDASKYSTIDGAKAAVKEIESRLKAGNKTAYKVSGPGPDSLLAKNETGLNDKSWNNIKAAAAGKRISDADLAKMISASDLPKDWWWTWSSTQENLVKDMLKDYPNR